MMLADIVRVIEEDASEYLTDWPHRAVSTACCAAGAVTLRAQSGAQASRLAGAALGLLAERSSRAYLTILLMVSEAVLFGLCELTPAA
jgi:hypothetical protein